ncbi:hypothetical protein BaRGS_00039841, partial [Batillaria attramentaria]
MAVGILIAMVALLVVTGIPVYMKMEPWIKMVLRDIFGQGPASKRSQSAVCVHVDTGGGGSIGECAKVINQMYRDQHTRLKQDDDNGPLQWKEDIQGAPLRNFALDATSLRVEVSGYYYIYSHVTFTWKTKQHARHCLSSNNQ